MKKFPHLVEMHKQYAKDGLAIISVSLDRWEEDDPKANETTKTKVSAFLKEKGATFTNLLMTEDADFNFEKMRFRGTPCIFVFSRDGKWTQFKSDKTPFKDEDVDRLVLQLLKEK